MNDDKPWDGTMEQAHNYSTHIKYLHPFILVEHQHGISCSGSSCGLPGPGFLASISIKLGLKNVGKTPFHTMANQS